MTSFKQHAQTQGRAAVAVATWQAALKKVHRPAAVPALYAPYASAMGQADDLPIAVNELQNDHVIRPGQKTMRAPIMGEVDSLTFVRIAKHDADAGRRDARLFLRRAKKYGMRHDGSYGSYGGRKLTALRVLTAYLERCNAAPLLAFLDAVRAADKKCDDLADALLLALEVALEHYEAAARARLGVMPAAFRRTPTTLADGTVRVYAVDPGTRHYARALVEVAGTFPLASDGAADTETEDAGDAVLPPLAVRFRVLQWELIDLLSDGAALTYRPAAADGLGPYYAPIYPDIAHVFQKQQQRAAARPRKLKRKRTVPAADDDDDAPPRPSPRSKRPRVAPIVVIDLVEREDVG